MRQRRVRVIQAWSKPVSVREQKNWARQLDLLVDATKTLRMFFLDLRAMDSHKNTAKSERTAKSLNRALPGVVLGLPCFAPFTD